MAEDRKGGCKTGCLGLFLFFVVLSVIIGVVNGLADRASPEAIKKSKETIDIYHSALKSGKCQGITDLTSVSAIAPKDLERLVKHCEALSRKYGNLITSDSMGGPSIEIGTTSNLPGRSGNFIILDYDSKFSSLSIVERFTWRFSIFGRLELASYETSK
jgi:hypothetical protein